MAGKAEYKNQWQKENCDRVNLTLPKGRKAELQAYAAAAGESLNGFIGRAINEAMARDGAGGPQEAAGAAAVAGGISLSPDALESAQAAAAATGEALAVFIARAIETQVKRDKSSLKLGINPVTGDKLKGEA